MTTTAFAPPSQGMGSSAYADPRRRLRLLESGVVPDPSPAELLHAAAAGDRTAWDAIVDRYCRLVWSVVRGFRLDDAAAADVTQTVWLRLVEHCDRIRDPDRLPGWLAATARNEALRVARGQIRQVPSDFAFDLEDATQPEPDERLTDREERSAVLAAFARLPADAQQLLRLLCSDPPLDYQTIAELIGRPVGSIGPTRARVLEKLRALLTVEMEGKS